MVDTAAVRGWEREELGGSVTELLVASYCILERVGLMLFSSNRLRSLITRLESEGDYYVDPGLIEKALLAAGESTRSG